MRSNAALTILGINDQPISYPAQSFVEVSIKFYMINYNYGHHLSSRARLEIVSECC